MALRGKNGRRPVWYGGKAFYMLDLHMHSTASDGTDTPSTIVTKCKKLNLRLAAVTDHDTIDGQKEAVETARKLKTNYITGIEFSVKHEGELHLLGYGIDIRNKELVKNLEILRESRIKRVENIVARLQERKIKISMEDVIRNARGNSIGRPHIALAMIEKGYVSNFAEAFTKYLNEGGLCYVQRWKIEQKKAFELILAAGGTPVLAHPKFIKTDDFEGLVKTAKDMGLAGIEAYYPAHNDLEAAKFEEIAKKYNLIVTCGSDYHGKIRAHSAIACEKRTSPYLEKSVEFLKEKYNKIL